MDGSPFPVRKYDSLAWHVVMTMPHGEARAEAFFRMNGTPCYLPKVPRSYANRVAAGSGKTYAYEKKAKPVPMLPGYIFAALDLNSLAAARSQKSIARVLLHTNYSEDELLRELRLVREFEALSADHRIEVRAELATGRQVEIVRGNFAGWTGVIEKREGLDVLQIRADCVGYALSIACSALDCELTDMPR